MVSRLEPRVHGARVVRTGQPGRRAGIASESQATADAASSVPIAVPLSRRIRALEICSFALQLQAKCWSKCVVTTQHSTQHPNQQGRHLDGQRKRCPPNTSGQSRAVRLPAGPSSRACRTGRPGAADGLGRSPGSGMLDVYRPGGRGLPPACAILPRAGRARPGRGSPPAGESRGPSRGPRARRVGPGTRAVRRGGTRPGPGPARRHLAPPYPKGTEPLAES